MRFLSDWVMFTVYGVGLVVVGLEVFSVQWWAMGALGVAMYCTGYFEGLKDGRDFVRRTDDVS